MKKQNDRQIIEEMQRRYKEADGLWGSLSGEFKKHKRFALAPNGQWTEEETNRMGEPCMQTNRMLAYVMQVINTTVKQDIGCDITPVSEGADKVLARVRQAQIMAVWDKGDGKGAFAYALKDQICGGYGVLTQTIDWATDTGFDKKITFKALKDASTFRCDPSAKAPALCDMKYAMIESLLTKGGFEKQYGEWRDMSGPSREKWEKGEKKKIIEYWRIVKTDTRKVFLLEDGGSVTEEELKAAQMMAAMDPEGAPAPELMMNSDGKPTMRNVSDCQVEQLIIGNDKVLKKVLWPGSRLPFKVVEGREYWEDGKKSLQPMTLAAENPQKKYNFIESQKAILYSKGPLEIVFIPAGGDSAGINDKLQEASRNGSKNIIVIPYETTNAAGQALEKPIFKPPILVDAGLTTEGQLAIKDIEACFGIINAGWIDRPADASGVAIERTEAQGETSNFDYPMASFKALEELWKDTMEIIETLGIPMQVKLAGDDQREETVWVANKNAAQAHGMKNYDLDEGEEYSLIIKARPAPDTLRQKSFDQMNEFAKRHPNYAPIFADLDARSSLDNLYSDDIAERLHKAISIQFPGVLGDSGDPRVQAAQQQVQQAQAQMQQMQQAMQQIQQQAQAQVMKLELQLAGMKANHDNEQERITLEHMIEQERVKLEAYDDVTKRMKVQKEVLSPSVSAVKEVQDA